jgi:DNA-binding transcriptional regulator YdaS (Cro superfamily)
MRKNERSNHVLQLLRMNAVVQSVCGIYSRVARQLGLTPSFVSRVARGERTSAVVEEALITEFNQIEGELSV